MEQSHMMSVTPEQSMQYIRYMEDRYTQTHRTLIFTQYQLEEATQRIAELEQQIHDLQESEIGMDPE